jgi:hypothetical protein
MDMDRHLKIKLQGTVILPSDFRLSTYYFHISSAPWSHTLRIYFSPEAANDVSNPPYVEFLAE